MKISLSLEIIVKGATGVFDSFRLDPDTENDIAFELEKLLYNALNCKYTYEKYQVKVSRNEKDSSQQLN